MIQGLTQYLLNKDHQHPKWQPHKSWTLFQDYQDRQLTQYPAHTDDIEYSRDRMSIYLDMSTETQMAKIMVQYGSPSCSSWTKSVRSSFGRNIAGNGNSRKCFSKYCLGKFPHAFVNRGKRRFLSVHVDDKNGRKETKSGCNAMWKALLRDVDLGELSSFLDHVYFGCTHRECQDSKGVVDNYRSLFESWISAWISTTQATGKRDAVTISSWSYDMEGHANKSVEILRIGDKNHRAIIQSRTPCMDDHLFFFF